MEIRVVDTPNPLSKKFVLDTIVNATNEKIEITNETEAGHIPMAKMLIASWEIKKLAFFGNTITVTIYPESDWRKVQGLVEDTIGSMINDHNPNLSLYETKKEIVFSSPEHEQIYKILDKEVRPVMQADGGDIEILKYEVESKYLYVSFTGNCGSCPSAIYSTLEGIKAILAEQFDPDVHVIMV